MSKDIKNTSGSSTNANAVMEGYLMKWANIFSRYHKYLFWIEDGFLKQSPKTKEYGQSLRAGKQEAALKVFSQVLLKELFKAKQHQHYRVYVSEDKRKNRKGARCIPLAEAFVESDVKSKRKFKVFTSKDKIRLRAQNQTDRDKWLTALKQFTASSKTFIKKSDPRKRRSVENKYSRHNQRQLTLQEISLYLTQAESNLNKTLTQSSQSYNLFIKEMQKMEHELEGKKNKERFGKLKESSEAFTQQHEQAIVMLQKTTKSLFGIVEDIAEKEIERDPLEFIKRESFVQNSFQSRDDDQMFYSFKEKPVMIDAIEEENEFDCDEYDDEQAQPLKVLHSKIGMYANRDEESKDDTNSVQNNQADDKQDESSNEKSYSDEKELDDVFHDAQSFIPSHISQKNESQLQSAHNTVYYDSKEEAKDTEPLQRDALPYFKDPKMKISMWTILKDSIGKDITKLSVPVYFNDPTNILQKCCLSMEYNNILDDALKQKDSQRRLAYVAIWSATILTSLEKQNTKPFNPLLGETYELVTDKMKFFAEQVSHHPPISAFHCTGNAGWKVWSNNNSKSKFNGKNLNLTSTFNIYVDLDAFNERYEITAPTVSAHNLVIGTLYLDLGGKSVIKNVNKESEQVILEYHKRGWSGSDAFKVDGHLFSGNSKPDYKIEGKWSDKIFLTSTKNKDDKTCVFSKQPYHENCELMYGMSYFGLQLNYFPQRLKNVVAPTDTRRRTDQRALENGEMKLAAAEKTRLEEKQRTVRKYKETHNIEHKPVYFELKDNPHHSDQQYWMYNVKYFEHDRPKKNWDQLPDLFGTELPAEIKREAANKGNNSD